MKCKQFRCTAAVQMKMKCSNADDEAQQGRRSAAAQMKMHRSKAAEAQCSRAEDDQPEDEVQQRR